MPELNAEDLQPLWDHMSEQHGLNLTFTELFDVVQTVRRCEQPIGYEDAIKAVREFGKAVKQVEDFLE